MSPSSEAPTTESTNQGDFAVDEQTLRGVIKVAESLMATELDDPVPQQYQGTNLGTLLKTNKDTGHIDWVADPKFPDRALNWGSCVQKSAFDAAKGSEAKFTAIINAFPKRGYNWEDPKDAPQPAITADGTERDTGGSMSMTNQTADGKTSTPSGPPQSQA